MTKLLFILILTIVLLLALFVLSAIWLTSKQAAIEEKIRKEELKNE